MERETIGEKLEKQCQLQSAGLGFDLLPETGLCRRTSKIYCLTIVNNANIGQRFLFVTVSEYFVELVVSQFRPINTTVLCNLIQLFFRFLYSSVFFVGGQLATFIAGSEVALETCA